MSDSYDKRLIRFAIEEILSHESNFLAAVIIKESFVETVHQKWKQSEGTEEK